MAAVSQKYVRVVMEEKKRRAAGQRCAKRERLEGKDGKRRRAGKE
jgi:hypothetical protein